MSEVRSSPSPSRMMSKSMVSRASLNVERCYTSDTEDTVITHCSSSGASLASVLLNGRRMGNSWMSGRGKPGCVCLPFKIRHMKFSPTTPTGQYDSSLPSRRSSLFVSDNRIHVADRGIRNRGIVFKIPAESYIAGACGHGPFSGTSDINKQVEHLPLLL